VRDPREAYPKPPFPAATAEEVLGECIRRHVKEEERELFPACRKSTMNMAEIGARLQQRKDGLMRKLAGE
jgi:hypothetical protein